MANKKTNPDIVRREFMQKDYCGVWGAGGRERTIAIGERSTAIAR